MKTKKAIVFFVSLGILLGGIMTYFVNEALPKKIEVTGMVPVFSEEEIILKSDIVVSGTVKNIGDGKWSNPNLVPNKANVIQTDVEILISKVLWGEYNNECVTVRIDKGYDKETNIEMISDGYPDFKIGENVVLFLARDDSDIATDEDYFVLTGMRKGKLKINNSKKPDGTMLIENDGGSLDKKFENESISSLSERIREVKQNNPDWAEKHVLKQKDIIEKNKKLFGN